MSLDEVMTDGHESVTFFHDETTGLEAIIAIYDTSLGPSLGGTRILDYETKEKALEDVLRLSRGMAYKAAAADLPLGGGKAVIINDPDETSETLFEAYGKAVDSLEGRYITAEDVNTSVEDMAIVQRTTDHVTGLDTGLGDPSPVTARGILECIKTSLDQVYADRGVEDIHVAVQGAGKVGKALIDELRTAGATVTVADVDEQALSTIQEEYDVTVVDPDAIYDVECDVFAPCALGGVLNDDTIDRLRCDIIAGSANNQLASRKHAEALDAAGILYAPDYVINAGGLITVYHEMEGNSKETAYEDAEAIADRLKTFYQRAEENGTTPLEEADSYAEQKMQGTDHSMVF
ncbi:MAG: leucine dehydrogenase [Candidatus Nanohaloarchaeota archaeon QJJ-5]|nr:leucine dehydrogenase [Candidatus Nanohaloarchaeota archaeon QJJ-5]